MSEIINWAFLKKHGDERLEFEHFCFHVASCMFEDYGKIEYFYNTPGSEFYIELKKPLTFGGKTYNQGDVLGWQAKYWRGAKDDSNSPLDADHKKELRKGFEVSMSYRPNLKLWIVCTPGSFVQKEWDKLVVDLRTINSSCDFASWHREIFEDFYLKDSSQFNGIFKYYFGEKFIGLNKLFEISCTTLEVLKRKYDVELHTASDFESSLLSVVDENVASQKINGFISRLKKHADNDRKMPILNTYDWRYSKLSNRFINYYQEDFELRYQLIDKIYSLYYNRDNIVSKAEELLSLIDDYCNNRQIRVQIINEEFQQIYSHERDEYGGLNDYLTELARRARALESVLTKDDKFSKENLSSFLLLLSRKYFQVFAKPGYGKTHLACSLTDNMLKRNKPVLFFMGSSFRNCYSFQSLVLERLGLNGSMSFSDMLDCLDFLARVHHCKLPIIIDGLNETAPNEERWKEELPALKVLLDKHSHLLLVTTCRDKTDYLQAIYGVDNYTEVENHILLNGLVKEDLEVTVDKYFSKYEIRNATVEDFGAFENPLLLKIFCITNKNKSNIVVNNYSLVSCMDDYSNQLLSNISMHKGKIDKLAKHKLEKNLHRASYILFENDTRYLDFYNQFAKIFDDKVYDLINEGLCFTFEKNNGEEQVQYTYDMVAGFHIAKSILHRCGEEEDFKSFIDSNKGKFFGDKRHTLAEDIIKSLFYLVPIHYHKEWFEIMPNPEVINAAIDNLDIFLTSDNGRKSFVNILTETECTTKIIEHLFNALYEKVSTYNIGYISSFLPFFTKQSGSILDQYWNSKYATYDVMQEAYSILHDRYVSNKFKNADLLAFALLMCGITDMEYRENFCKQAFLIIKKNNDEGLRICSLLLNTSDPFVREAVISVIAGLGLHSKDWKTLKKCIDILEKYLQNHTTTNVVLLDDLETLYSYAEVTFRQLHNRDLLYKYADVKWSDKIEKKWALFSVFDYDYDKSYIRPLFIPDYCHKTYYTSSHIYGMLQNMAECLGYDQDVCSMLQNEEYEKVSYRRQLKDKYAFKYGQAALYELYGWLLLNGKLENEYVGTFRTPLVRIDPSFPIVLQKRNLFTVFLLPKRNEDLGNWIKANVSDWQASLIMTKLPNRDGDWILLYGTCYQMMSEKHANIYLEWNSFLVQKDISPDEVDLEFAEFIREYDHAFLEELSWRELINTQTKHTEDNVSILVKYSFSEWTTKRFKYKSFVCLSSEICQMLELTFDVDRLAYTFANEDVSTSFIGNDSMFFFLRKDVVDKLLEMKKSYLYIQMEEHRSIIGKLPDTIEEPEIRYNHKVSHKFYSAIPIKNSIGE
ncbi:hypothetical protein [Prevotella sp.]|uniref:hypothetical protein n=1 Tax=Prevotella sp. TaxID=59823 RepID=UPI0025CC2846|nr:hypothetical protein [Prevotella sp.]